MENICALISFSFQRIPKESANLDGKKLKDFKIGKRLGQNSCNSAVYEVTIDKRQVGNPILLSISDTMDILNIIINIRYP